MSTLSVVIATKDRAAFLEHALASLEAQTGAPTFETIVVDNGSSDATPEVVRATQARGRMATSLVSLARPNRAAARNAGIAAAGGELIAFVDDDVVLPPHFLAAHAVAHTAGGAAVVTGPILNVPSYEARPKPAWHNYSGAFLCTCNASAPRASLLAVGGFDESFDLYGWEDTELGLRLRHCGLRHTFAWNAYVWHIKPPQSETIELVLGKTVERARMAARLVRKAPSWRSKLATGAYGLNLVRSTLLAPPWSLAAYRRLAANAGVPGLLRAVARAQLLDGSYTATLRQALTEERRENDVAERTS